MVITKQPLGFLRSGWETLQASGYIFLSHVLRESTGTYLFQAAEVDDVRL